MRALNVLLSFVVSLLLGALVFEGGLRLLGMGPQPTLNRFDPDTGWSKIPGAHIVRKTREFTAHFDINQLGLRDDPMESPAKPAGTERVLVLGDSFVLGYTVERDALFVDLLERWWKGEGRKVDVINTGTEGFSTDQEVAWFEKHGAEFQPDVVVIVPYENDLYWDGQLAYHRFPKPRWNPSGVREPIVLQDPGELPPLEQHTAIGKFLARFSDAPVSWSPDGRHRLEMEHAAYFHAPPEFMKDAIARTRGALIALKNQCAVLHAKLFMAPIPGKACVQARARTALEDTILARAPAQQLRRWILREKPLDEDPKIGLSAWSPDQPVDTFLDLAKELSIQAFDARAMLRERARTNPDEDLYYRTDWHFDPSGNRAFARFLHDELERAHAFPDAFAATRASEMPPATDPPSPVGTWLTFYAALWLVLSTIYALTYRDEPWWKAALGVAGLLALVFTIAIGGGRLLGALPPAWSQLLAILFVLGLFTFVLVKLGRRLATIAELVKAFALRGHWYLMPLVVVLLSIGSLLVVAASSPLVAPFIYTLF